MLQQYISKHNSTQPAAAEVICPPLASVPSDGLVIVNRDSVYSGEASFWIPTFNGTPPANLLYGFVVRADATRLSLESLKDVVFSAAFSGMTENIQSVSPVFFRLETTEINADFFVDSPGIRWFPPEFGFYPSLADSFVLNFSDCCSFDAFPSHSGHPVYFGVAFSFTGLHAGSFVKGLLSMRCNYSERIPFQPLKA